MPKEVVIKLREILDKRGLEQKQLAEMTGLSVRAVSELVNNKTERIPKSAIVKIAESLGIEDIREILELVEEGD